MVYSIFNQKGGTGKTTTTVNLGCALAYYKKKVLLIDLDPQGNLTFSFGIKSSTTVDQLLTKQADVDSLIVNVEGVDVVPSSIHLANAEINIITQENREYLLDEAIKSLDYDYILIDCPPSLSMLTVNALVASNKVLIPMQPEVLSIKGLDLILETVEGIRKSINSDITIDGILAVMVDRRKKLSQDIIDYIQENYTTPLLKSAIRTNVKASEAPSFGKSVLSYAPKSSSALDYLSLAKEIISRHN